MTGHRRRASRVVFAALLWALPAAVSPVAAAGEITFGDPSATAEFGNGITFAQPVAATGVQARYVDILITRPGFIGPEVHTISQVGTIASTTFEYSLREADQHLYPNTHFTAHWRITDTSGTVHLGPETSITYSDTRFQWQSTNGDLIRVHWYKGDAGFGQRALAVGQAGVARAEEMFGVTETDPIDFYVYADIPAFYGALGPGTRENVGGEALPEIRTLFALITPDQINEAWVGVVIPHELTHLVFDTAVNNPYHSPPRWFNEGLAVYLTEGYSPAYRELVRDAANNAEILPLVALEAQFPTRRVKFTLAYAESVSALEFLVRTHGRDALVNLVRSYADGVTDDEAFSTALGVDLKAFNDAWLADVGARQPVPQGPRPDPVGPLPSGWSASPAPVASSLPIPSSAPTAQASASFAAGVPPSLAGPSSEVVAGISPGSSSVGPAAPTPGVIAEQPVVTRSANTGLAALFALIALVLASLGLGLVIARRRSLEPR